MLSAQIRGQFPVVKHIRVAVAFVWQHTKKTSSILHGLHRSSTSNDMVIFHIKHIYKICDANNEATNRIGSQ